MINIPKPVVLEKELNPVPGDSPSSLTLFEMPVSTDRVFISLFEKHRKYPFLNSGCKPSKNNTLIREVSRTFTTFYSIFNPWETPATVFSPSLTITLFLQKKQRKHKVDTDSPSLLPAGQS